MSRIILLVEDSFDDALLFERAFTRSLACSELVKAASGYEALKFLESLDEPPALVVSDLKMPGMDGIQLLRAVRAIPHLERLPIVILTSSDHPRDLCAARAAGASGYIVKPSAFTGLETICRTIRSFIEEGIALPEFMKL